MSRMGKWAAVVLMVQFAIIVGGIAGLLVRASAADIPTSILGGGGAFAPALFVLLGIAHYTQR